MQKFTRKHRILTFGCVLAIIYLCIAHLYTTHAQDNVTVSGTVYFDEGVTPFGAGSGIALHVNGSAIDTTTTDTSGQYAFTGVTLNAQDVVTIFIDNASEDGVLITKHDANELTDSLVPNMHIYANRLIVRTSLADLDITTANLDTANNGSDTDIDAIYTIQNEADVLLSTNNELFVWTGTTLTLSGKLFTHDVDVRGILDAGANDITASGSVIIHGNGSTVQDLYLQSIATGELLQLNGVTVDDLIADSGLEAYFRFDEGQGTTIASASFSTSTGGTLTNGPAFITGSTGGIIFYNPHAIRFDGSDDVIDFDDTFDLTSTQKRTFTLWFRRDTATSEDVLLAKKTNSGSSAAGYMLYIDDESDKLIFEVSNGTNTYTVTSNTAITDSAWHHAAVSFDGLNTNAINLFIDGTIDTLSKTGALESGGALSSTISNAVSFRIGDTATSSGPYHGAIDDVRLYTRVLSGSEISVLSAGNIATGSGTYLLKDALDIDGNMALYGSTIDVGTGYTINVGGNLTVHGLLRTNSGTIALDGTDQTIRGSTRFNQLSKTDTVERILTFESKTLQSFSGALTLQGATSNRMKIRATVTDTESFIVVEDSGATILNHLNIQDSNASSGDTLYCASGCIDMGNNTNWVFLSVCGDGVTSGSEQCDDGNLNNNDVCPNDCQFPVCGDGVLEGLEECEPPNVGSCRNNCLLRSAGGGAGGGGGGGSSSSASGTVFFKRPPPPEGCGNAVVEVDKGEECDRGTRLNGKGTCSFDCKKLFCGDGVVTIANGEECEPTIVSNEDGLITFEVETCGEICTAPNSTPQGGIISGCKRVFLPPCEEELKESAPEEASEPVVLEGTCGNGLVEEDEECDFGGICEGGDFDGSFWTNANSAAICAQAGGTPLPQSGDGCTDTCTIEFCGDGIVQSRGSDNEPNTEDDEECDNGSACSNDPSVFCTEDSDCGPGNTCEYHAEKDVSCSSECKQQEITNTQNPSTNSIVAVSSSSSSLAPKTECGNEIVEDGEECDEGDRNGIATGSCSADCETVTPPQPKKEPEEIVKAPKPFCGNGVVEGQEQCDDGERNSDIVANACRTNCAVASCGDLVIDSNEECDAGIANSNTEPDRCRTSCRLPRCGDRVKDSGEECDGNPNCTRSCTVNSPTLKEAAPIEIALEEPVDKQPEETPVPEIQPPAPKQFVLDADIVVVNPTEIANAVLFTETCGKVTIRGTDKKAKEIRKAAVRQKIPIVTNITLAQYMLTRATLGEEISGLVCDEILELKKKQKAVNVVETKKAAPVAPPLEVKTVKAPAPKATVQYANLVPIALSKPPVGQTGPASTLIVAAGAACGYVWKRKRNLK